MNYIYDILLNFQKNYYDFYEWNEEDDIYHMRKIPIIKIDDKTFLDIQNNIIKFDKDFLENIPKAERFKQIGTTKIKNLFIVSNEKKAIGIKLSKDNLITHKSSLLTDEEDDIIELIKPLKEIEINYQIINKENINNFKTRFEIENENYLLNELNKIYNEKDIPKLQYLYLECFNKKEENINKIYNELKKEIIKVGDNFHKLFEIFKLASQK